MYTYIFYIIRVTRLQSDREHNFNDRYTDTTYETNHIPRRWKFYKLDLNSFCLYLISLCHTPHYRINILLFRHTIVCISSLYFIATSTVNSFKQFFKNIYAFVI